jgi:DNA polymerase II small subunit
MGGECITAQVIFEHILIILKMNGSNNLNNPSRRFLEEGFLISPATIKHIPENFDFNKFFSLLESSFKKKPLVINKDILDFVRKVGDTQNTEEKKGKQTPLEVNWFGFDEAKTIKEKNKDKRMYKAFLDIMKYSLNPSGKEADELLKDIKKEDAHEGNIHILLEEDYKKEICGSNIESEPVMVLDAYVENTKEREVQDFVNYFKARYNTLKGLLSNRQNLQNATSINRILNKTEKESIEIIGIINNKRTTKNGNIILTLEDLSGSINVLVNKNRKELFETAKNLLDDEVIGVVGSCSPEFTKGQIVFCDEIITPDIPADHEFKKLDREVYAVFTGDIHLGNKYFCAKEFLRFIDWINGESGTREQREVAKKVKYLFLNGDLVDGVGVYPEHDKDLDVKDIYEQYSFLAEMLSKIRKDVKIILVGGNHDALRIAEPQPPLDKKLAAPIYNLPNAIMVNNPATVNICSSQHFNGFNILLYHGNSMPHIAEGISEIRMCGGIKRPDLIMKALLRKRHLAPPHNSSLYVPDNRDDPLVIKRIPDFFVTGHIHRTIVGNYKNVTLVGCGCWIKQTEDQKRRGIEPDPSRVTLVNLKTREVKLLYFGD